jgi:hypothetical protein
LEALGPFFERYFILGGPEAFAEKYSKYGPNGLMAKNQDRDPVILSLPF